MKGWSGYTHCWSRLTLEAQNMSQMMHSIERLASENKLTYFKIPEIISAFSEWPTRALMVQVKNSINLASYVISSRAQVQYRDEICSVTGNLGVGR